MTYEIEFILNVIFVDFAQELMSTEAAEPRDPRNYAEEKKTDPIPTDESKGVGVRSSDELIELDFDLAPPAAPDDDE